MSTTKIFLSAVLVCTVLLLPTSNAFSCERPPEIKGANERHFEQIALAEESGAVFFKSGTHIQRLIEGNTPSPSLVLVPEEGVGFRTRGIGVHPNGCREYPASMREYLSYVTLDTLIYIRGLGRDFRGEFPGRFFEITGLSRTKAGQEMLWACGRTAHKQSPHQYGITFDLTWKDLSRDERCWILERVVDDQRAGLVMVVDEITNGRHLHITVRPGLAKRTYEEMMRMFPINTLLKKAP